MQSTQALRMALASAPRVSGTPLCSRAQRISMGSRLLTTNRGMLSHCPAALSSDSRQVGQGRGPVNPVGEVREEEQGPVTFELGSACKLVIQLGDLTKWCVNGKNDAVVNPANSIMLGGGGLDGAIHEAAGWDLYYACLKLPVDIYGERCQPGEAVATPGFQLPVSKIIHTVGPVYDEYEAEECAEVLKNAFRNSLKLARKEGVKYIAFPAIACGAHIYPLREAATIAIETVKEECEGLLEVHFVLFEKPAFKVWLTVSNNLLQ